MRMLRVLAVLSIGVMIFCATAAAQIFCPDQGIWTSLNFPVMNGSIDAPFLLTDGRVMVQYVGTNSGMSFHRWQDWYALTPDNTGDYINGTWSQPGDLQSLHGLWSPEYGPNGYASAVLPSGKLLIQGGENNLGANQVFTNMGAIYDPVANSWTKLQPPGYPSNPWPYIGDAASVVLPNDTYMVDACNGAFFMGGHIVDCPDMTGHLTARDDAILLDPDNQTWQTLQSPGNGKNDRNSEEGWTLLPGLNGEVLTIDLSGGIYETFNPSSNMWSNFYVQLLADDPLYGDYPSAGEIGPAIVTPDGNVFATGAADSSSPTIPARPGYPAIYNPSSGWTAGPTFPHISQNLDVGMGDEMAVLLRDGNVLMSAHDTYGSGGNYHFLEYQYEQSATQPFCPVNAPGALTQSIMSSSIKMLVLPTGQVFVTNTTFSSNNPSSAYYIYTPASSIINSNWRPSITMVSNMLTRGSTGNLIQGIRFNGLSQANMFGDDFQNATNYPLVRITNTASGQVIYAKTHDPSTMAIATGVHIVSTEFDVPPNTETGQSSLVVVANGIASIAVTVTINN